METKCDISKENFHYEKYNYEDCVNIGKLYQNNNWNEIYKLFPGITKQQIYSICSKLKIKKLSYFWSEEDTDILINNYGKITIDEIYEKIQYRHNKNAISTKAQKLGLTTNQFWSDKENEILINNYSYVTKEEMIRLLPNRTYDAIMNHAEVLGIKSFKYLNEKYSLEQKQFIIDNWQNMNDQEIADIIGKTSRGVMEQRNKMGLFKINKEYGGYENIAKLFRGHIQNWKTKSMELCDYKCVFTGSKDFRIHHLIGFNIILKEAFDEIKKEIELVSNDTNDYTKKELDRMIEIFCCIHDKYPLGICVRNDIHNLFHRIYGVGNNNEMQWNKFVTDYKNGVYNFENA